MALILNDFILMKGILTKLVSRLLKLITARNFIVLGDSHALVFISRRFRRYFPLTKFDVCSVGGATASGLDNPISRLQHMKCSAIN